MIGRLKGNLGEKNADRVVVDVHGVGYEVHIPFSTYYELGDLDIGDTVSLHIYTHLKEDALTLYGVLTLEEKKVFSQLIRVTGIGPRLAVTVLSGLPVDDLVRAISKGDVVRLSSVPGVGKKTAERMVLEMKDKVTALLAEKPEEVSSVSGSLQRDVVSALVNLGYPKNKAESAVTQTAREEETDRFEVLLRLALKRLSG